MGEPREPDPVLLVVAAFSRHADTLARAHAALEQAFGPVALAGEPFAFDQTAYYERSMGTGLRKQLLAFRNLVPADALPDLKHRTNALERELAAAGTYPEPRPLNVDPGLLALGKFLLATTKDQGHRVYLRDGIHAEVTLRFQGGLWKAFPWTYADYRLPGVHSFLLRARSYYRDRLRTPGGGTAG